MKKIIYLISSVFCDTVLLKIEEKSIYESDKEFLDINEISEFAKLSCIAAKIIDSNLTESILTLLKPYEVDYMVYKDKDAVMALIDVIEGEKVSENVLKNETDNEIGDEYQEDEKKTEKETKDEKTPKNDKKRLVSLSLKNNFQELLNTIDVENIVVKSKAEIDLPDSVWLYGNFIFITKNNKIIVPKGTKAIYGEDSSGRFSKDASEKRKLYINSDNVVNETLEFDSISGVCQFLLNKKINGWTSFANLEGKLLTEYR